MLPKDSQREMPVMLLLQEHQIILDLENPCSQSWERLADWQSEIIPEVHECAALKSSRSSTRDEWVEAFPQSESQKKVVCKSMAKSSTTEAVKISPNHRKKLTRVQIVAQR